MITCEDCEKYINCEIAEQAAEIGKAPVAADLCSYFSAMYIGDSVNPDLRQFPFDGLRRKKRGG